ncbi:MAG: hypothetical protein IJT39_09800 [Bacteroidales bacterium]|nr:hypothetical protein [Bacteroidales bacterium]
MEKSDYVAPVIESASMTCERGYASSDWDHTPQLAPPDGASGNTASHYNHETWVW